WSARRAAADHADGVGDCPAAEIQSAAAIRRSSESCGWLGNPGSSGRCVCGLWAAGPLLPDCFDVVRADGLVAGRAGVGSDGGANGTRSVRRGIGGDTGLERSISALTGPLELRFGNLRPDGSTSAGGRLGLSGVSERVAARR